MKKVPRYCHLPSVALQFFLWRCYKENTVQELQKLSLNCSTSLFVDREINDTKKNNQRMDFKMGHNILYNNLLISKRRRSYPFYLYFILTVNFDENAWYGSFFYLCDETLYFPLSEEQEENLCTVVNNGSDDKWRTARSVGAYDRGIQAFEIEITHDSKSSNTWRICVGCVPVNFSSTCERIWVGSQSSWAYIGGTGGKCFNSGQSTAYGEQFTTGDIISVVMDFDNQKLEFFKNGDSQGIAFDGFKGPVFAAVSVTAENACLRFRNCNKERVKELVGQGINKREKLQALMQTCGNAWDPQKISNDMQLSNQGTIVQNTGSNDKWRACAAVIVEIFTFLFYFIQCTYYYFLDWGGDHFLAISIWPSIFRSENLGMSVNNKYMENLCRRGKCHHSGKSTAFGTKFEVGDRIGVLMDFDNHTLEFFRNDKPQGEAFNDLYGPVFAAVSSTGEGAQVELLPNAEQNKVEELFLFR
ncbi:ran-binding protein [Reticulomyxa filosa]|uniref:Ran-binding protein n=1 Tax=Reticulomyxa filosa TaxID=46433 RepID=X6P4M7_RETFI|nr:ran-binding protein [Reticulomyxa filosa]|eukprot:ETO33073.1 ran-binding protein [Reticulomyxa filosa]